jgi:hypothetical protein
MCSWAVKYRKRTAFPPSKQLPRVNEPHDDLRSTTGADCGRIHQSVDLDGTGEFFSNHPNLKPHGISANEAIGFEIKQSSAARVAGEKNEG